MIVTGQEQEVEFGADTHTYRVDDVIWPSVTQILKAVGLIPEYPNGEHARERGKAVHSACHYLDDGDLDESTVSPEIAPYLEAYRRFKTESRFVPEYAEQIVAAPAYRYCGTVDRVGTPFGGGQALVEIKTGQPEAWHEIQTAAYALAWPSPVARFALYLRNDGTYRLLVHADRRDTDVWRAAITLFCWRQLHDE